MKGSASLNILLIEDSAKDLQTLTKALAEEPDSPFTVQTAETLYDGLEALSKGGIDLVLLDLMLPDSDGLASLEKVREHSPHIPIVVLTASDDRSLAAQSLQKGAQDYLVKGYVQVYRDLLGRSIRYAIERQRAEEAVTAAHEQREQLFFSIPSILIGVDDAGLVTHWNGIAESMFGITAAQMLGRPLDRCPLQWDTARVLKGISDCRSGNHAVELDDMKFRRAGGQEGFLGLTIIPVKTAGGPSTVLLFGADVTERKWAEQERARLQGELLQAQKMETIGRFAGGIAHDFNNYLQVILGFGWIIRSKHGKEPEILKDFEEILHAAESASGMVRQLLAFSRRQPLKPQLFDINRVIKRMERLLGQVIGQTIRLQLQLDAAPLIVKLDPTGLEQIVMNLCSNARDSMPNGGTLTLSTSRVMRDVAPYVRLSVIDTGVGMEPELVEHIFEPFFTTKERGRGTGLGLAVVHGLVEQHEGHITLETAPGKGTTFHLDFPLQQLKEPAAAIEEQPSEPPAEASAESSNGSRRRILLVDDDPSVRMLCERILNGAYAVTAAASGSEALQALQKDGFDMLLTDIKMPEMDGFALIEQAKKLKPNLLVVAMTGFLTREMEQRLISGNGVFEVIRKPFTPPTVRVVVDRCLTQARS